MNLQIVLNAQKNPFSNQATRKKNICQNFATPKNPEIETFTHKNSFGHPCHLKSAVSPWGWGCCLEPGTLLACSIFLNTAKSIELACKCLSMVSLYWMIDVIHPINNFLSVIGQC